MADRAKRTRKVDELVELSQHWHPEDLLANLQEELRRMEEGMSHLVWDAEMRRVTRCPNPLPVTPKSEVEVMDDHVKVRIRLPRVREGNISLRVGSNRIEVLATTDEMACKPYFLSIDAPGPLDPATAESRLSGGILEITVRKVRRVKVKVR